MAAFIAGAASASIGVLVIKDQLEKRGMMESSNDNIYVSQVQTLVSHSIDSMASAAGVKLADVKAKSYTDDAKVGDLTKEEEMKVEVGKQWNKGVRAVRAQISEITKHL